MICEFFSHWPRACKSIYSLELPPHAGFQSPRGWDSIFGIRNPNLNLHLSLESWLGGPRPNLLIVWKGNMFWTFTNSTGFPVFRQGTNYICFLMFGLPLEGKGSIFFQYSRAQDVPSKYSYISSTRWAPTMVISFYWSYGAPINGLIDWFSWGYNPSYRSHFTPVITGDGAHPVQNMTNSVICLLLQKLPANVMEKIDSNSSIVRQVHAVEQGIPDGLRFDRKFPVDMEQRDLTWNKFNFEIWQGIQIWPSTNRFERRSFPNCQCALIILTSILFKIIPGHKHRWRRILKGSIESSFWKLAKTQKERLVSQPPIFGGENVGFREGNHLEVFIGGSSHLVSGV